MGLVDSVNRSSLEEKLSTLISKWKQNDMSDDGPVSLFCAWFRTTRYHAVASTGRGRSGIPSRALLHQ